MQRGLEEPFFIEPFNDQTDTLLEILDEEAKQFFTNQVTGLLCFDSSRNQSD